MAALLTAVTEFSERPLLGAWFFSKSRPQVLFFRAIDTVKIVSCVLLSLSPPLFSSNLCFRPGYRFVVLCLFCLQLSVFIFLPPVYVFATTLHHRPCFFPISFSHILSLRYLPCPFSPSRPPISLGSVDPLCPVHYSSIPDSPSPRLNLIWLSQQGSSRILYFSKPRSA